LGQGLVEVFWEVMRSLRGDDQLAVQAVGKKHLVQGLEFGKVKVIFTRYQPGAQLAERIAVFEQRQEFADIFDVGTARVDSTLYI
jgi:hypothetical protein